MDITWCHEDLVQRALSEVLRIEKIERCTVYTRPRLAPLGRMAKGQSHGVRDVMPSSPGQRGFGFAYICLEGTRDPRKRKY